MTAELDGRGSAGRLLRTNGQFARVFGGTTVSLVGTAVAAVSLPLVAVVLGASALAVGVIEAAVWTPWLLLGLVAGAWADRYSPRRLIVAADLVSAVLYAAVPVLAVADSLEVWYLVVLALAAGSSDVISQAALGVLPPMLVRDADLESANAALQTAESTADFLGGPGSSLATRLFGATGGLGANAVTFLVSAVAVAAAPRTGRARPPGPEEAGPGLGRQIADGLRELFGQPLLRRLALTGAAVNTALTGSAVLHALFLVRQLGVPATGVGLLLLGQGAGGVLGAVLAPSVARRLGAARAIGVTVSVTFPFALLTPLAGPGWRLAWFVVGTGVPVMGVVAANVLGRTLRQRIAGPGLLGRVAAGSRMLAYSTSPVAALLAGGLATAIGFRASYLVFALLLLLLAVDFAVRPLREAPRAVPGA